MIFSNALLARTAVLCFGAASICCAINPASATNARSWNNYTWGRGAGVLTVNVVNNTSAKWTPYVVTALSQWSTSPLIDMKQVAGPAISSLPCSASYAVVEICSANYGATGWYGMTNVYTSGGHIVMATVRYNDFYVQDTYRMSNTACHELGHVLGLNHQDASRTNANSNSCLDTTNDPGGKKAGTGPYSDLHPGTMDFAALADIYKVPSGIQLSSTSYTMTSDGSFVPEPAAWALMLTGFGLVGITLRRRSLHTVTVTA